jgi:hypothetical protein
MSSGTVLIVVVAAVLGLLSGLLLPPIFRSRRPFGLVGDVLVATVLAAGLAWVEWVWILPALGFETGWISVMAAIGDPVGLAWLALWLMRRVR